MGEMMKTKPPKTDVIAYEEFACSQVGKLASENGGHQGNDGTIAFGTWTCLYDFAEAYANGSTIQQGKQSDEGGTITYSGALEMHSYGEADDILFLSSLGCPLAEVLQEDIAYKTVTARYWITDKPVSKQLAQEGFIQQLMGETNCDFGSCYSEITGYLWTDEEIRIGGHDLIAELRSHVGKFLILEIKIHDPQ
jgi:hypothetical protein